MRFSLIFHCLHRELQRELLLLPIHILGEYRKAIEYHEKRLAIALEVEDRAGQGKAYGNLGNAYLSLGEYRKAIGLYEKHLAIALEVEDRAVQGAAYGI